MGNNSNKEPKESLPHSVQKPGNSVTVTPSPTPASTARLELGFKAHASLDGTEKTALLKQDFTDAIFVAIPAVGKRIYKYFVSLQSDGLSRNAVDRKAYALGGEKIISLLSDEDQLKFYIDLFAKGKNIISRSGMITLLSVSEQASWLSAGISLPPTPETKQHFDKTLKSQFKDGTSLPVSDVVSWSQRLCPRMTANLHSYVTSCLFGDKTSFSVKATISGDLVTKCKDGRSLLNLSSMWLLTCVLPRKYFPISASSSLLTSSNIGNIVWNNAWHSLYDSNSQGLSVNRFQHHVMDYNGPTIFFLSFDQYLYAVSVDLQWTENTHHWGGVDGMFFQIQPDYRLIQSGEGLVYLNLTDRTAPKGLQFGKDSRTTFLKVDDELNKVSHYSVDYKLTAIEVWGCGGQEILTEQHQQQQWEHKEVIKSQSRKLVPEDWKENPDKAILEMGGVSTEHNQRTDI